MRAVLVAGLAFGDEAKGATVDYLCRRLPVDTIVRYNGGCQAAHNVVTPEGVHHTFSQFGSGMLASPTVKTHLSRYMLVEPISMMREAEALGKLTPNLWERTTVDRNAVIVTPLHRHLNQLREQFLGDRRHGSCGRGIGVARELELKYPNQILRAKHLHDVAEYAARIEFMFSITWAEIEFLHDAMSSKAPDRPNTHACFRSAVPYTLWPARIVDSLEPAETMVFEGAQGVMLDEKHGTAPHTTWTNTTFENADTLLDELGVKDRLRIGCLRSYYTRHGAGPFPTEYPEMLRPDLPEPHNSDAEFAGRFRTGAFDFKLAWQALSIAGGVDFLAISHLDHCNRVGLSGNILFDQIEKRLKVPVGIYGRGPTANDREMSPELSERLGIKETVHA